MLSKDVIQTIDSSPKHFIKTIAITNSENVLQLPYTDSTLYKVPSYLFRALYRMYDASTD